MCDAGCGYNGSRDGSAQKLRDIISLIRGDNVVWQNVVRQEK